ncbi:MAG TPA: hypothetical protein ENI44_04780, partial [Thermoplasmatales archaeon]|nr:hypothetical protein [Thermoplasmatales archaeon]
MDLELSNIPFIEILRQYNNRAVIMIERSTEGYFEHNMETIRLLLENDFEGIYISFQRPFINVYTMFEQKNIDTSKLLFIDAAAALSGEIQVDDDRCIHISEDIEIDELVRAIYTSIPRFQSKKNFIFIDSLTTIALYKPLSETMRFSEFLVGLVRKEEKNQISLIFNV